ncbi:hypothetical protein [Pantoea sp.]|uniref:MrpH family fimbial adhesin n=1 Tax=Pantoea sp. TaxID=69393 RepID=UPI0031D7B7D1
MKVRRLLLLSLMLWLSAAIAGPFPVPLTIYRTSDKIPQYRVNWAIVDIPEADAKAPAGYWFGSAVGVANTFSVIQSETCVNTICATKVKPGETISAAAMRAYNKGPTTTYHSASGGANGNCVAFGGIPQGNTAYASAILPTGCMRSPPTNLYCFIVTPEINLNHGTIALKDVTNSTATATVNINCSQQNNVKLSLESKLTYVQLNNNYAKANLLINNKLPGKQHALPIGLSSLTITSKLEGINQGGNYSGSAVLIIEPI